MLLAYLRANIHPVSQVEPLFLLMPRDDALVEAGHYGRGAIRGVRHEPTSSFFNTTVLSAYSPAVALPVFVRAIRR